MMRPNGVEKQVRPPVPPYLCFTAEQANSTVILNEYRTPPAASIETSTDGNTWSDYSFGTAKTLSAVGDKIYFRNKSDSGNTLSSNNFYYFSMAGKIAASGDVSYLVNINGSSSIGTYGLRNLFRNCDCLTTPPMLNADTVNLSGYSNMFANCTELIALPKLPATTVGSYAYQAMFYGCTKIKLSTTQTGEYQTPYSIPSSGTGSFDGYWGSDMFGDTGGTFTGTPTINTTYYTSNTVV